MRNSFVFLALLLVFTAARVFGQDPVPSTFFGMHAHFGAVRHQPWPSVPFGGIRLWDAHTHWYDLNPKSGVYNWDSLDLWLDAAQAHHLDVIYTFGGIPEWASGDLNDPKCRTKEERKEAKGRPIRHPEDKSLETRGSCHPPADLREDGTGSDQTWKDFVTAIAKHAHGRIKYWEAWNEPHVLYFWHGTMPQIVRMTEDLRTIVKGIDPGAVVISPGTGWQNPRAETGKTDWNPLFWTDAYLAAGGNKYIDILGIHGYLHGECPSGGYDANQFPVRLEEVRKILRKNGVAELPIWSTEGSWGKISKFCTADLDMQVAFVGQYYITGWANGFKRMYWYAWNDGDTGELWNPQSERIQPAGVAYGEVYKWMVGATLAGCDHTKTQTSCAFHRPDGTEYLATWDGLQTCSQGSCNTVPVKVDAKYVDYLDLAGGKTKIQNSTVPVGLKPIWLEAPAPSSKKGANH